MEHIGEILTITTWLMITIIAALSSPRRLKDLETRCKAFQNEVLKQDRKIAGLTGQKKGMEEEIQRLLTKITDLENELPF